MNNYTIKNMCPICRKNGGLLPVNSKFKTIVGIHDTVTNKLPVIDNTKKIEILDINPNKLPFQCGVKLKTKDGYCVAFGKKIYGGFCGKHCKNQKTNIVEDNSQNVVQANISTTENTLVV
jgi:hypothetical protein